MATNLAPNNNMNVLINSYLGHTCHMHLPWLILMLEACSPFQTQEESISSSTFLTSRSYFHPLACLFHFQSLTVVA